MNKFMFRFFVALFVISFSFCSMHIIASAQVDATKEQKKEEKYEDQKREITQARPLVKKTESMGNLKINTTVGLFQGYDNNVNLDSSRKGDSFNEIIALVDARYPLNDWLKLKFGYNTYNVLYYDFTNYTVLDNAVRAGLESKIADNVTLDTGYEFEYIYYPKDDQGTYYANKLGSSLRHKISKNLYHKLGYEFQMRDWTDRKARNGAGVIEDTERQDYRNSIKYEIGYLVWKTLLKLKTDVYFNDSNDEYLDYYDYTSYSVSVFAARPLVDKLTGILRAGYQWKRYDERTITTGDSKEKDKTMILGAGLTYDITRDLALSANYTYRQNYSNDPIQRYSESMTTLGCYYTF